jgi:hypothetical protein
MYQADPHWLFASLDVSLLGSPFLFTDLAKLIQLGLDI